MPEVMEFVRKDLERLQAEVKEATTSIHTLHTSLVAQHGEIIQSCWSHRSDCRDSLEDKIDANAASISALCAAIDGLKTAVSSLCRSVERQADLEGRIKTWAKMLGMGLVGMLIVAKTEALETLLSLAARFLR